MCFIQLLFFSFIALSEVPLYKSEMILCGCPVLGVACANERFEFNGLENPCIGSCWVSATVLG